MADDGLKLSQAQHDFMLECYRGWLESMHRSEEIGEKRIEFFITFATAVLGGAFGLAGVTVGGTNRLLLNSEVAGNLVRWSVVGLLVLGLVILLRLIKRNKITDLCLANIKAIRKAYETSGAMPAQAGQTLRHRPFWNGGLVPMMTTIDALLCGVAVAAWVPGHNAAAFGVMAFAAGFLGLLRLVRWLETKAEGESR